MTIRRRWYGSMSQSEPRGVVQVETPVRNAVRSRERLTLPEGVLRLAQAQYEHQFGRSQDYERMQERGGLGVLEVVALLADLAERLGAKPNVERIVGDDSP